MPRTWFPVKALLGHRPARLPGDGGCEYLVRWDGVDPKTGEEWEPTWEPNANISAAALEEYHINLRAHEQHWRQGRKEDKNVNEHHQEWRSPQLSQCSDGPSNPVTPPKQSQLCTLPVVSAGPSRSSESPERRQVSETQGFSGRDGLIFDASPGPREQRLPPLCSAPVGPPPRLNIAPPPPPPSQSRPKRPAGTASSALSRSQVDLIEQNIRRAPTGRESPAVDENLAKKRRLGMFNLRPGPPPKKGENNETPLTGNWERNTQIGLQIISLNAMGDSSGQRTVQRCEELPAGGTGAVPVQFDVAHALLLSVSTWTRGRHERAGH